MAPDLRTLASLALCGFLLPGLGVAEGRVPVPVSRVAISSATGDTIGSRPSERYREWLPDKSFLPTPTSGPRDPVSRADLIYVARNPSEFGDGLEAEFALALAFPLLRIGGASDPDSPRRDWIVGIEAAAFARFGLHRTERELVNTDWFFTVPLVRWHGSHWGRIRYYHTSSHLGDEYARRFDVQGENFARDALDGLLYLRLHRSIGAFAGVGWAFNVHPEDSRRGWVRGGVEWGQEDAPGRQPFAAFDVNMDQDVGWTPRWSGSLGMRAPSSWGGGPLRVRLAVLSGPTPLGQFQGGRTRQFSLGIEYAP
jgi:hypothetical protein